jgi:cytochrome c oxidase assembly factor CtaG
MPDYPPLLLRYWSFPPIVMFGIELSALVYLIGWWRLHRAGVPFVPRWRAVAFLSGLCALWIAVASPIDALNGILLSAHMLQHMLLMMAAPPLILLGAPLVTMTRGLSTIGVRRLASIVHWPVAERVGHTLTNPATGALLMSLVMFAWHTPSLYELALRSEWWHESEHASFFLASLIFWWPVVLPWPSRSRWPRWAIVPYLLFADVQNTALSAILAFSDRVLYPSYVAAPRLFGLSALEDQVAAGAFMWVAGSLAFIVPAIILAIQCLSMRTLRHASPLRTPRTA